MSGPLVVGGVVVLHGDGIRHVLLAVRHIIGRRRREHLPVPVEWAELESALTKAMSACPQSDSTSPASAETTYMDTRQAAAQLGCTERHARRLAGQLDGKREGGRWVIPESALREHLEGAAK